MRNEQMFAPSGYGTIEMANGSRDRVSASDGVDDRLAALLKEFERIEITPMSRPRTERTLYLLGRFQTRVQSMLCDVTRTMSATNPGSDPAEVLRTKARLPQRESKRIAKVARHLSDMPKVREKFADGDITLEHATALSNAAEKVGPDAVESDPALLDSADQQQSDTFHRHAKKWSERKLIERGVSPLERQRRAREAKLWVEDPTGLGVLMTKLPASQFIHLRQAIDRHYMQLLRQDGADGTDPHGVRNPKQRLADAVFELVCNRDANTGEPIDGTPGGKAKASTQVILVAPLGVIDGTNPQDHVDIVGAGPVPRRILETLTPDTELAGMIFDRAGRPLWLGRNQRLANAAQRLAVAVRDGGCFECGAPMHRCELHHIKEWHRDHGPTDVNNLVAVCRKHHKQLETDNLTVTRTPNGYEARPRDGPSP